MFNKSLLKATTVLSLTVLLSACGSTHHPDLVKFKTEYGAGNYEKASLVILPEEKECFDKKELGSDAVLIGLQSGTASLSSKNFVNSAKFLDVSDQILSEDKSIWDKLTSSGYEPKYFDKIMMNAYKGLAFWAQGDIKNAKIEFNRVYARQKEAIEENKKEIAKQQAEAQKESAESLNKANEILNKEYTAFNNFKPYADFTNPYATYMAALFSLTTSTDKAAIEDGVNYLKRVKTMSNNKYIDEDIKMAEKIANGGKADENVWVIYEEGLSPEIDVKKFQIPFITKSGVKIANLSLPDFKALAHSFNPVKISTSNEAVLTETLADMEKVIKTEYKERYPAEVAKGVAWMVANLVAQEAAAQATNKLAGKHGGLLGKAGKSKVAGSLVAAGISQISNPIETRTWSALPKEFQMARVKIPADRKIQITSIDGKNLGSVKIEKGIKQALVYVRSPKTTAKNSIFVINMAGK